MCKRIFVVTLFRDRTFKALLLVPSLIFGEIHFHGFKVMDILNRLNFLLMIISKQYIIRYNNCISIFNDYWISWIKSTNKWIPQKSLFKKLHVIMKLQYMFTKELIKWKWQLIQTVMQITNWLGSKCVKRYCNILIIIAMNTIHFSCVYNILKLKVFLFPQKHLAHKLLIRKLNFFVRPFRQVN